MTHKPLNHQPRKRFGQNFLHDKNIIHKIIHAIAPQANDTMVEIGPGQGALTQPLLEQLDHLHVIEIDNDLVQWWKEQALSKLTLHHTDALKTDLCTLTKEHSIRLVGNLPYNISTPLLFHFFKHSSCIEDMHFMLQKEVVERIVAQPGSKTYGRLSIMSQFYCEAEYLFTIGPGAFHPKPKVDSAIIRLRPHHNRERCDANLLSQIVKQAFS